MGFINKPTSRSGAPPWIHGINGGKGAQWDIYIYTYGMIHGKYWETAFSYMTPMDSKWYLNCIDFISIYIHLYTIWNWLEAVKPFP